MIIKLFYFLSLNKLKQNLNFYNMRFLIFFFFFFFFFFNYFCSGGQKSFLNDIKLLFYFYFMFIHIYFMFIHIYFIFLMDKYLNFLYKLELTSKIENLSIYQWMSKQLLTLNNDAFFFILNHIIFVYIVNRSRIFAIIIISIF